MKNKAVLLVQVKLSMCFINYAPRHEDVWGSGGIAQKFLTSALDGGQWSAPRPGGFTPEERTLNTHRIGGWIGPGLDAVRWRKISCPRRESSPGRPRHSPSQYRLSYPGYKALLILRWGHWILQLTYSFQPHYGPGVDSTSNRNDCQ
jgi:hypothetical protein